MMSAATPASAPNCTESKFVSYPAPSSRLGRASEAVALLSLARDIAQPPVKRPLVCITLEASLPPVTYKKQYAGKRQIRITTGTTLDQTLLTQGDYFPRTRMLSRNELVLDEGHYHHALRSWQSKSTESKVLTVASGMTRLGAIAFTVQFSDARRKLLEDDQDRAFRKLRNDLAALNGLGAVVMIFEVSGQGRLHVHGLIQTTAKTKDVKALLRRVGGRSHNAAFTNLHQVKVERARSPICWALYCLKGFDQLSESEIKALVYISRDAIQLGTNHVTELRGLAFKKLGLSAELRGRMRRYTKHKAFASSMPLQDLSMPMASYLVH